jgi:hypothetical protein
MLVRENDLYAGIEGRALAGRDSLTVRKQARTNEIRPLSNEMIDAQVRELK